MHGDLNGLRSIVKSVKDSDSILIFLGDYIDRGPSQVEVFAGLLNLALRFSENIILLRGNHEPPIGLEPFPHDYPYVLRERFGGLAEKLYELSSEAFNKLVLFAIARGEAILVHGGPPTHFEEMEVDEMFSCTDKLPRMDIVEEILWNDPFENVINLKYDIETSPKTICNYCPNKCLRTFITSCITSLGKYSRGVT
ncbi:MAG TPA: serine/threonine protein phosphatase [Pyrodictiaceae archaeon]|nr:serine/threonine protein phosphatase [Pyrodictiaceae archaeon]